MSQYMTEYMQNNATSTIVSVMLFLTESQLMQKSTLCNTSPAHSGDIYRPKYNHLMYKPHTTH